MTVFLVYREEGLPKNSEALVSNYLKNKFEFSKLVIFFTIRLAFLSDSCDLQKDHNNLQIIWGRS